MRVLVEKKEADDRVFYDGIYDLFNGLEYSWHYRGGRSDAGSSFVDGLSNNSSGDTRSSFDESGSEVKNLCGGSNRVRAIPMAKNKNLLFPETAQKENMLFPVNRIRAVQGCTFYKLMEIFSPNLSVNRDKLMAIFSLNLGMKSRHFWIICI